MKKKSKCPLTPKLRFPEFRDETGWVEVPLEQIAERVTTKNLDGSIARVLTNSAEHGVVDQRDYFDKDIANAGNIDGYYIVDVGDYVYNPRISSFAPVGPISRNNIGKGVMSPLYTVFRFADEKTDFYQHYFKTVSWHLYLKRVSSMGARHDRMSITNGDFMAMPVPTPPAREQEKIADCLGSLDGLIAAEGRKLAALRDHKRGLMQQLFPQPGQTQPRLRFPEFLDKGEWKKKAIETVGYFTGGGTPSKDNEAYWTGKIPWISSSDLTEETIFQINVSRFITEQAVQESATKLVPPNSILLVSRVGVGKLAISTFPLCTSQDFTNFTPTEVNPLFLAYLLRSQKETLLSFNQGTSIKGFTKDNIATLELGFPIIPAEQQKIADCLSALDALITAQAAKIETLKQHKRGLMQQLFPAPEDQ